MSWYLLPSGMPFYAVDGTNLAARLISEHATVLAGSDVGAAITAWNARVPGPGGDAADFVTEAELEEALAGAGSGLPATPAAPTGKYLRGDKTWQPLATDPGLSAAYGAGGTAGNIGVEAAKDASAIVAPFVNLQRSPYGLRTGAYLRNGAQMTNGNPVVTAGTSGDFTNAQVGMFMAVAGAGAAGAPLIGTIASKADNSTVTMSVPAATTATGQAQFGWDNTAALQAAIGDGRPLHLPGGGILSGALNVNHETFIEGSGRGNILSLRERATRLMLKAGTNAPLISASGLNPQGVAVQHMQLDGAKALQTTAAPLINMPDMPGTDQQESMWSLLNLLVQNSKGQGFYYGKGNRGCNINRGFFYTNDGDQIDVKGTDGMWNDLYIGAGGHYGMYFHDGGWSHFIGKMNNWSNQVGLVFESVKNIRAEGGWIDSSLLAGATAIGCAGIKMALNFSGNSATTDGARAHIELGSNLDKTDLTGCNFPAPPVVGNRASYCVYSDPASAGAGGDFSIGEANFINGQSNVNGFNNLSPDAGQRRLPAATQAAPMFTGRYHSGVAAGATTSMPPEGTMRGSRLVVGRSTSIDRVALEITTAGSAGAVVRLGVYKLDPNTGAATLLVDAGTIDGTVVGVASLTVNTQVRYGDNLLLVACIQGGATTRPTLRTNTGVDPYWGDSTLATVAATPFGGGSVSGVSGALPATATFGAASTSVLPRVLVRAA